MAQKNSAQQKRRKLRLVKEANHRCYYCTRRIYIRIGLPMLRDTATIEHLYGRHDIRRFIENPIVAACHKCNNEQNEKFNGYMSALESVGEVNLLSILKHGQVFVSCYRQKINKHVEPHFNQIYQTV